MICQPVCNSIRKPRNRENHLLDDVSILENAPKSWKWCGVSDAREAAGKEKELNSSIGEGIQFIIL